MKTKIHLSITVCIFIACFFILCGCSAPSLKMAGSLPSNVRLHNNTVIYGNRSSMSDTGIYLNAGDTYSILASGSMELDPNLKYGGREINPGSFRRLMFKIGDSRIFFPLDDSHGITDTAPSSGKLYLGLRDGYVDDFGKPTYPQWYNDNLGSFDVDIIVWQNNDWGQITDFYRKMQAVNPDNKAVAHAFWQANNRYQKILVKKEPSTQSTEIKDAAAGRSTKSVVTFNFPKTKLNHPDAIAVVIGNRNYTHKDIPPADYAIGDARAIKNFLINTMGYKDGNVLFETDVVKSRMEMLFGNENEFRGMLYNYVKPGKSDVFIYYSGHGAPSTTTYKPYFVPTDADPAMMSISGYSLDTFYKNLERLEAISITVVIESCFSGNTDAGTPLVKNASPALITLARQEVHDQRITILTSSKDDQVSSWYPEKEHSLFTFFFLDAVSGKADIDKNKIVTIQEIFDFISDRAEGIPYWAKRLHNGRIQIPTLHCHDKDAIFVDYN